MSGELTAKQLAKLLEKRAQESPEVFRRASVVAAQRARTALVKKTPVDQGIMKNAWHTVTTADGARVENLAPHAGIVEGGARPHPVSAEGIAALTEWAIRKGYAKDEKEAAPIVWGIVKRLKTEGQKGLFIARDLLPQASRWLGEEFVAQLKLEATR